MTRRDAAGTVITVPLLAGSRPMGEAAEIIAAAARESSARWSRRVPRSVKVSVSADGKVATITAGAPSAPQAYTMEGKPGGRPRNHPVYGRGDRPRSEWTWVSQVPVRPFMAQAADAAADRAASAWGARLADEWARRAGFR